MSARSFLHRRLERLGDAALNLLPSPVTRSIDQARHRSEMRRMQEQLDAAHAEIARLKRPKTPREQRVDDEARRRRDVTAEIARGNRGGF